ncbi:NAD(P)H-binding protein [Uliginosibacterium sp. 31-16]|uniref:NAD(P)-dependent oxidoreductase n=1 Tax=Uliginosibacterium sp. 31-16 TaxID=3068315 RepID=UPI00273FAB1C|nr:NAD(P)H-binding protein [Uliginosibacterium sp. 31-16]MDP5239683.1 NAD(P)H-binding protein [Uliginosibacterium sp. 31-16]
MKIALIAATGNIGSHIARNALARGHQVKALVRSSKPLPAELAGATAQQVELTDAAALAEAVRGADVIASAFGPRSENLGEVTQVARALIAAARSAGVNRVVLVGGAGSLEVAPGVQLVDVPQFPEAYKAIALAHREAYEYLRTVTDIDWTFYAPAAMIGPGDKLGNYRTGSATLISNAAGQSSIHYPDYAEAFVAELEVPQYPKTIATVAYA